MPNEGWVCVCGVPASMLGPKDCESEASLSYIKRYCLKQNKNTDIKQTNHPTGCGPAPRRNEQQISGFEGSLVYIVRLCLRLVGVLERNPVVFVTFLLLRLNTRTSRLLALIRSAAGHGSLGKRDTTVLTPLRTPGGGAGLEGSLRNRSGGGKVRAGSGPRAWDKARAVRFSGYWTSRLQRSRGQILGPEGWGLSLVQGWGKGSSGLSSRLLLACWMQAWLWLGAQRP